MNARAVKYRFANLSLPRSTTSHPRRFHRDPTHFWARSFSRRQFIRSMTGAAGFIAGSSLYPHTLAAGCADPSPIPGGQQFLSPDPTVFHILLPGYPFFPDHDTATNDPSVITDFNGHIGLAYVQGNGTHRDLTTGQESHLPFEVDLRFMMDLSSCTHGSEVPPALRG